MSERTDLYSVLGVKRSASQDEIKRAYRRLAKKHHPDRNPSDASAEGRFKEVQRAYDTLSDAEKRSQYDQFGDAAVGQVHTNQRGRNVYQWGGGSSVDIDDLQDLMGAFGGGGRASIFNDIFGRPQRPQVPSRGTDEEHRIALSFDQAIHGATVTVQLRRGPNGKPETLEVKVPPGVEDQQRIRLRSKGNPGARGGPPGDLLLVCSIQPHPYFTRRGADIHLDLPVSVIEAVLGARIDVPSIDGAATVTLPPGTPGGTRLRLVGRGVRKQGKDERGDQYITVRIVPPKTLTKEDRSHYEALKKLEQSDPRSQCGWAQGA